MAASCGIYGVPGWIALSFYPRLSPDHLTLWISYDGPRYAGAGYFDVDMAVWAVPLGAPIRNGRAWTVANNYTGGDLHPIVVPGGHIYIKYLHDQKRHPTGPPLVTDPAGAAARAPTPTDPNRAHPAPSPARGRPH